MEAIFFFMPYSLKKNIPFHISYAYSFIFWFRYQDVQIKMTEEIKPTENQVSDVFFEM